ncbi:hypothetical protein [Deinococcus apachensis]|nr:hypothetical protein [Deinococcus apachensis]
MPLLLNLLLIESVIGIALALVVGTTGLRLHLLDRGDGRNTAA